MSNDVQITEEKTEKEYEVEKILDRKIDKNECYYYHIQWVGYSQTTWEPLSNLIGSQAVEKMVSEFEKTFQRKTKNNWSKGLAGWANVSKNPTKPNENANKQDLDETFYKVSDTDIIIDLDKVDEPITKKKRADRNQFLEGKIRKKVSTFKNQRYPFEKAAQSQQIPNFMKKILEIKRVQIIEGQPKCLVITKTSPYEQWLPIDIVRLLSPQLLLEAYEKAHYLNQSKNNLK